MSKTINIPSSIYEKLKEDSYIKIYPNPAQDYFNIEYSSPLSEIIKITLHNEQGTQVYGEEFEKMAGRLKERINVVELQSGPYFLSIFDEDGKTIISKKILKL